jgi:queuine tRNA-ribosyltransferase
LDGTTYTCQHIQAARFEKDFSPINPDSKFEDLQVYSKAYLRHLFRAKEILAYRLATLHNLEFYYNLMAKIRSKIADGSFDGWWERVREIKV